MLTPVYVSHLATGSNSGVTKADAFTSIVSATTAFVFGQEILMDTTHVEVLPNAWSAPTAGSSSTNPVIIKSIDFTTDRLTFPPASQLNRGGLISLYFEFNFYFLWMTCGNIWNATSGGSKNYSSRFDFVGNGYNGQEPNVHYDTILNIGGGSYQQAGLALRMYGGSIVASNSGWFRATNIRESSEFVGVECGGLSAAGMFNVQGFGGTARIRFVNCPNFPAIPDADFFSAPADVSVELINSGGSLGRDFFKRVYGRGSVVRSDYGVYLNSGYIDHTAARQSHRVETSATVGDQANVESIDLLGFFDTTGSKTLTVQLAHTYSAALLAGDVILIAQTKGGVGAAGFSFATSTDDVVDFGDPTALGAGGAWTGAGLTTNALSTSVVVNSTGYFICKLLINKYEAGRVLHYNPVVDVT